MAVRAGAALILGPFSARIGSAALLLAEGFETSKHSGVIAAIHQRYVRKGRLPADMGKALNWLFELRDVGDYGVMAHVSQDDAHQAIMAAERFIDSVKSLIADSA